MIDQRGVPFGEAALAPAIHLFRGLVLGQSGGSEQTQICGMEALEEGPDRLELVRPKRRACAREELRDWNILASSSLQHSIYQLLGIRKPLLDPSLLVLPAERELL